MAQLSNDCFAAGDALIPLNEALALLADRISPVAEVETVALAAARGRVLAADIIAEQDVPPHANSAVDGYAVYFADLNTDAETFLPVTGRAAAGHPLDGPAQRGAAVRIFTGAPMPTGSEGEESGPDTVMMQEDCTEADGAVRIQPGISKGANRREAGEDVRAGNTLLHAGQRLRPQDIGLAASIGATAVATYRPLTVALFSTGDELQDPSGGQLAPGAIYDSNRYTLAGLIEGLGCQVNDLGILPDREDEITEALAAAAASNDLLLTSGGMSVGEEDHVKAAVESLGSLHFWRLAIKPGRPVALGQVGATPFIGLPGNPVAVMVTFLRVARPMILRLGGATQTEPRLFSVRAGFNHRKKKDRREWLRTHLHAEQDGALVALKFPRQGAGILSSMVAAEGLVELPETVTNVNEGETVAFLPFSEVGL
jgi:molybdopterin molybdotransferase